VQALYHSVRDSESPINTKCEKRLYFFPLNFYKTCRQHSFKRKMCLCTDELHFKIKASDVWLGWSPGASQFLGFWGYFSIII
jgi:hypothetical protein